jgi:hypothetical protein
VCCCCCRYAKTAGKDTRTSWLEFTKQYFLKRRVLVAVMLLVDSSIPPQRMDLDCANWLAEALVRADGGSTGRREDALYGSSLECTSVGREGCLFMKAT